MIKHLWRICAAILLVTAAPAWLTAEETPRKLPDGVMPLGEELQKQLDRLQLDAARLRGLTFKTPVLVGQLDEPTLKKQITSLFKEDLPPEKLNPVEEAAKAFELIPQEMDLGTYYPKLLTSQVGGFYEPKKKFLVLVAREGGILGPDMSKRVSPVTSRRLSETVLLHELVHALQDQYYDLEKYGHDAPLSDASAAKLALIEGDATVAMQSYLMGISLERMPGALESSRINAEDSMRAIEMMPGMPGAKELAEAPAFLREALLFSYNQGLVFAMSLRMEGGQKLLDYAFSKDPPESTEQIIHPEKYLTKRDNPVKVELPDLSANLPGYTKRSAGDLGEFGIRLLLTERLGREEREQASRAAAGWGGDAFTLYGKDKEKVLVWVTDWDSAQDAKEFENAALRGLKGWAVSTPSEKRVVLVKGTLEEGLLKTVQSALADSKATPSTKSAPDLAALGITAEDRPKPLDMTALAKVLQDPVVKELMQMALNGGEAANAGAEADDLTKLLDTPATRKLAEEMLGEEGAEAVQNLMKDENVQKELAKLLAPPEQADKGKVSDQTYSNEQYGLSITGPAGDDKWTVDTEPEQPPMGARSIVEFTPPAGVEGKVAVVAQNLPMPLAAEQMGPMMEMVLKSQFQNYKKVKSGTVTAGEVKGFEMEFSGDAGEASVHVLQRMFVKDNQMITVLGTTDAKSWDKHGESVRKCVESLTFGKPAAEPK